MEVHAKAETSILFLGKKDWSAMRREGRMKPVAMCSSMKSRRAVSSVCNKEYICLSGGVEPSSRLILRSYGWCGARVSALALSKTSAKSWYSSRTEERSTGGESDLEEARAEMSFRLSVNSCVSGNLQAQT